MTAIDRTAYPPSVASVRDGLVTTFYTYLQLTPDRPPLGDGRGAGPSRLTPTGLPLTLVADAPTPADGFPSQSPTDRPAGKAVLVWSKPVVTELFGDEARARRTQVERAELERAEIIAMRGSPRAAIAI
jgi:hypothetical protein